MGLSRYFFCAIALLSSVGGVSFGALAQTAAQTNTPISTPANPQPKLTQRLAERLPASVLKEVPVFLSAEEVMATVGGDTLLKGSPELRRFGTVIRADQMSYNQDTDTAKASGGGNSSILINRSGNRYWGDILEMKIDAFEGFFTQTGFRFLKNNSGGRAERIDFLNEDQSVASKVLFSSCQAPQFDARGKPWKPDWVLSADTVKFDIKEDIATAKGATLRFKGVPILPVPSFDFPLSDKRKSGFLPLSIASDNRSGFEVVQPYYWNVAPNRDATLFPTYTTKRGYGLGTELRYLEPSFAGRTQLDMLPNDQLYRNQRWGLNSDQAGRFDSANTWRLQINRVSDNDYWKDFLNQNKALTQRLLQNNLTLTNTSNGWVSSVRTQRWQTLQDSGAASIIPPFDRTPQLNTRKNFVFNSGLATTLEGDFTSFNSRADLTGYPNARRVLAMGSVSKPWISPSGYITPKLAVHARSYQFEAPTGNTSDQFQQRIIPTFSVDSGLAFERATQLFGEDYSQTLEPRLYYVRTPYRNQDGLPNYDSGVKDFSFSSLFSENRYVGNDRIADANLVTLGVVSRFNNPDTGAEHMRFGVAQRHSFSDPQVTLPKEVLPTDRVSDWLLNGGLNLSPKWAVDSTVQFGQKSNVSERTTLTSRYNPTPYRNLYAGYRMQRNVSEQADVGWQWPLSGFGGAESDSPHVFGQGLGPNRWYSVGRANYSIREQRMVSAITGFEFDGDCWIGRVVVEQTQLDINNTNRRIMFQLEFSGFTRVGISPLSTLRANIPRYQNLRENTTTPNRFTQYD